MAMTIIDEISGEQVVIENPLLPEHVEVGRLLWYNGFTSTGSWNCPAVITRVSSARKRFKVRSLDDMLEQIAWYEASASDDRSGCRQTMRIVTAEEVRAYLDQRQKHLDNLIESAQQMLWTARFSLKEFKRGRKRIAL